MGLNNALNITGDIIDQLTIRGDITTDTNISGRLGFSIREIGTKDYNELYNKPSINTVELIGDKSFEELGMISMSNFDIDELLR